jgi:hypothetical protein
MSLFGHEVRVRNNKIKTSVFISQRGTLSFELIIEKRVLFKAESQAQTTRKTVDQDTKILIMINK